MRAVFSFPVVLGALLVLLTMFTVRSRFSDPDTWWHLKVGELIWTTHSIPRADSFSFTAYGHAWIAQEWLSELAMYGAWKLGGYVGLMLGFSLIAALLIVAAYVLCTCYSGNCKVAFLGGVVVWLFSTIGLAIRPHMIGYLLMVCELLIIHLGRSRNTKWFLGLPFLFALWINFHSSFFFGLVVLGVVVCLSFLDMEAGLLTSTRWTNEQRKRIVIASVLSIGALFANPVGPKLLWYPVDVMINQPLNIGIVEEWQQTSFSDPRGMALLAVGALVLLVPLMRRVDLFASELSLIALGFAFAIRHERMLFVFGILAAPVLCRLLATAWDRYDPRRDSVLASGVMLGLVACVTVFSVPGRQNLEQQVEKANPAKALRFLRKSGLTGPMLNEYVFGGYLIWAAPEHKVFVDGRADLHESAGVLRDYAKWILVQTSGSELLDKYAIRICLLSRNAPMTRVLPLLPGWKQAYSDELAVVFARQ
ncbi:MAG: hypothetical protein ACJ74Y_07175 [Bryobacteraceae bacterium]